MSGLGGMDKIYNRADYVQQWGHPTSVGIFDSACQLFSIPDLEGIIGYRWQSKNAVVIGDPLCPAENLLTLVTAFSTYCKKNRKNIIYLGISERFAQWAHQHNLYRCSIEIGAEIILNPLYDPLTDTGKNASRLRNKQRLALKDGLTVHEYSGYDHDLEQKMEQVKKAWLENRTGPQIYLSNLTILADRTCKRYFYVKHHERMIGVLILNKIEAYKGWFINILMLMPDAHNSTSEFLILHVLDLLRTEQCSHFSIGINSTNQLGQLYGFNTIMCWMAQGIYAIISRLFALNNRERYWNKFNPTKKPALVLFEKMPYRVRDITDILQALNVLRT